ncbi:YciI family protein [Bradyrhizobium sp. UFLA05-153]
MLFAIHCLDYPDSVDRRLALYDKHQAYLQASPMKIVIAGPILAADGETRIGSMQLVEADDIEMVRRFNQGDPFFKEKVWNEIRINGFLKLTDNR